VGTLDWKMDNESKNANREGEKEKIFTFEKRPKKKNIWCGKITEKREKREEINKKDLLNLWRWGNSPKRIKGREKKKKKKPNINKHVRFWQLSQGVCGEPGREGGVLERPQMFHSGSDREGNGRSEHGKRVEKKNGVSINTSTVFPELFFPGRFGEKWAKKGHSDRIASRSGLISIEKRGDRGGGKRTWESENQTRQQAQGRKEREKKGWGGEAKDVKT